MKDSENITDPAAGVLKWDDSSTTECKTKRLLITADCGGSNGYRVCLWRFELLKLAYEIQKTIQVCHFPPGSSK